MAQALKPRETEIRPKALKPHTPSPEGERSKIEK